MHTPWAELINIIEIIKKVKNNFLKSKQICNEYNLEWAEFFF